jgi:hypothetical protein
MSPLRTLTTKDKGTRLYSPLYAKLLFWPICLIKLASGLIQIVFFFCIFFSNFRPNVQSLETAPSFAVLVQKNWQFAKF